jgi:hypothetical protein
VRNQDSLILSALTSSYYREFGADIPCVVYLAVAALLFAIGQIFDFAISSHICYSTNGKVNGALFETLFTLLAVVAVAFFWSSITEDDWPQLGGGGYT